MNFNPALILALLALCLFLCCSCTMWGTLTIDRDGNPSGEVTIPFGESSK